MEWKNLKDEWPPVDSDIVVMCWIGGCTWLGDVVKESFLRDKDYEVVFWTREPLQISEWKIKHLADWEKQIGMDKH